MRSPLNAQLDLKSYYLSQMAQGTSLSQYQVTTSELVATWQIQIMLTTCTNPRSKIPLIAILAPGGEQRCVRDDTDLRMGFYQ